MIMRHRQHHRPAAQYLDDILTRSHEDVNNLAETDDQVKSFRTIHEGEHLGEVEGIGRRDGEIRTL
jgi:hypothetical protein